MGWKPLVELLACCFRFFSRELTFDLAIIRKKRILQLVARIAL
jgi:hypothetical protein